jgi:hypothetical protein
MPLCTMLEGHLKSSLTRWMVRVSQFCCLHSLQIMEVSRSEIDSSVMFRVDWPSWWGSWWHAGGWSCARTSQLMRMIVVRAIYWMWASSIVALCAAQVSADFLHLSLHTVRTVVLSISDLILALGLYLDAWKARDYSYFWLCPLGISFRSDCLILRIQSSIIESW